MPEEPETKNEAEGMKVPGEETAETEDHAPRPWIAETPKQKRNVRWPIIITVAFVVCVLGGWSVYALWYRNSDKVVMDALANAMSSHSFQGTGTVVVKDDSDTVPISFDSKISYKQGATLKVTGGDISDAVLMPNGDAYLRSDKLDQLYARAMKVAKDTTRDNPLEASVMTVLNAYMGPKIKSVNGKWVRIGADDLKTLNGTYGDAYKCIHDAVFGIGDNATELIELGLKYNDNKFLKIVQSLPAHDGNDGYLVAINSGKFKAFLVSLKSTKIFKDINACAVDAGAPIDLDKVSVKPFLPKIELWISQWGHQLKEVKVATADGGKSVNVDVTTNFNVPVQAVAPKDSVPLKSLLPTASNLLDASMAQLNLPTRLTQLLKR